MTGTAPDLGLQSLRIIRAIESTRSITGASRALGVSQPAISQHLQRTESKLGVALVVRTGRAITLTDAGRALAAQSAIALDALDVAFAEIEALAQMRSGTVRLVGFPSASSTLVPALISTLRDRSPGVSIRYGEEEPPEAIDLVESGERDIGLVFSYPGEAARGTRPDRSRLSLANLFDDNLLLVLPRDHPLADEDVVDMIALEDDPWIAGCPKCRGNLLRFCERVGFEPDIAFETDNAAAVMGLVASGLGVTLMPRLVLTTTAMPENVVVRSPNPGITRVIGAVVRDERRGDPSITAALTALAGLGVTRWGIAPLAR
ncbi:LysR family transcriptional regulator [Microbacterium sp. C448]|uniref:LysR family transcriptional regulator n=1 Tax=Microbacterium sp. C448 TaxID=1177594 RepID=UPI00055D11DD|nr:LysR family transcriptional regulator [Microbacterium sp. C448]